jgi:nitric oxide reductase NorQ protein
VAAGHNPRVHGAVLTDALASRFSAQIQVSTDYELAVQLGIDRRAVRAAKALSGRVRRGEIGWAPQLRELIAFARIAEVLGAQAAAGNLVGIAPEDDRDTVAAAVRDAFGGPHEPLALGARLTPTPHTRAGGPVAAAATSPAAPSAAAPSAAVAAPPAQS